MKVSVFKLKSINLYGAFGKTLDLQEGDKPSIKAWQREGHLLNWPGLFLILHLMSSFLSQKEKKKSQRFSEVCLQQ